MTSIDTITLEVADTAAAETFYAAVLGPDSRVRVRASQEPTSGFRGFSLSLIVAQPADGDALFEAAVAAGATVLKPAKKSFWGYGGVFQAPDGTIWKVATPNKKNTGPGAPRYDDIVLLLGAADVAASKQFYLDHGLTVEKSFRTMYVEFASEPGKVKLGLYRRRALAKDAGVAPEGSGSHRIALGAAAGSFTDPDGFAWETSSVSAES
jgi:catechol 2,3-dioxygenase-like lactoylglutathione lyase family enzyme